MYIPILHKQPLGTRVHMYFQKPTTCTWVHVVRSQKPTTHLESSSTGLRDDNLHIDRNEFARQIPPRLQFPNYSHCLPSHQLYCFPGLALAL